MSERNANRSASSIHHGAATSSHAAATSGHRHDSAPARSHRAQRSRHMDNLAFTNPSATTRSAICSAPCESNRLRHNRSAEPAGKQPGQDRSQRMPPKPMIGVVNQIEPSRPVDAQPIAAPYGHRRLILSVHRCWSSLNDKSDIDEQSHDAHPVHGQRAECKSPKERQRRHARRAEMLTRRTHHGQPVTQLRPDRVALFQASEHHRNPRRVTKTVGERRPIDVLHTRQRPIGHMHRIHTGHYPSSCDAGETSCRALTVQRRFARNFFRRCQGQVLITSSVVNQARCAKPTPNRWKSMCGTAWASLSMENFTPW